MYVCVQELILDHIDCFARYRGLRTEIRSIVAGQRQAQRTANGVKVRVIQGPTGVGKTWSIHAAHPGLYVVPTPDKSGGTPWFDGYTGQSVVILDDFSGEIPLPFMLRLIDRYPMQVQCKGGFLNWVPDTVYITSNVPMGDWYQGAANGHMEALRRRTGDVVIVSNRAEASAAAAAPVPIIELPEVIVVDAPIDELVEEEPVPLLARWEGDFTDW
ncbi:putative replication protein [uncultured virus]|uniref:Putative replication protein n=1 Tax=uncultured virus TaxID=340016 RepID=A0A1I9XGE2_9VIRU|nr:putative replication protein [uncultured virus]